MKIIRKILIVVCVVVFVYSAYNLGKIFYNYYKIEKGTEDMIEQYVQTVNESDVFDPLDRKIDFESLQKRNSDVVGWLYIPETKIDEPIVRGKDNDTYLRSDVDHNYNYAGCIFIDANNNRDFKDMNTVIYGHNMKNGSRFHDVRYYHIEGGTYIDEHPVIYIYLPDGSVNCYQVMASGNIDAGSQLYNIGNDYNQYVKDVNSVASHKKEVDEKEAPIIMLSTCNSSVETDRYVVWAKFSENVK
jgi:sortase, SrtB family